MRKALLFVSATASFLVVVALVAAAATQGVSEPTRIHVVEHATTDTVVDTDGDGSDSTGDLLTFHNAVFGPRDEHRVGRDQGECTRISPARGTWQCRWTTFLGTGSISVEGPFFDARDSVFAITGGTGHFSNVRGQMLLRARPGGEFDFIFEVQP
jgi:hypothetical protein